MDFRRSSTDAEWQKIKQNIFKRDKGICRLVKCAKLDEFFTLKKNAGIELQILDPAHILQVSLFPEYCYDERNIVLLNRYSHDRIDHNRNPFNGKSMDKKEIWLIWERIMSKKEEQKEFFENTVKPLITKKLLVYI